MHERIGTGTDSNYRHVNRQQEFRSDNRNGAPASRFIGLGKLHLLQPYFSQETAVVPDELDGVVQCHELHAFVLCMVYFFHAGRHFHLAAPVDNIGVFCA